MAKIRIWEKIVQNIVEELKNYGVQKIILFGSRVKGYDRKNSDIDIAIAANNWDFRKKRKIKEKIDEINGLYSIDTLFLEDVSESFRKKVEAEGKVLYEKK